MNDIPEYLASIRYMMNEAINQLDAVHKLCSTDELDIETVVLNISDLDSQLVDIRAELNDMRDDLTKELEDES